MSRVWTFHVGGRSREVIDALTGFGFTFHAGADITTTLLDTFDGRLHAVGLLLRAVDSDGVRLQLTGDGITPAHLDVGAVPRLPAELPPGPFRNRVASPVGERALLARLRIGSNRTLGAFRDAADKLVVTAEMHTDLRDLDRPGDDLIDATIGTTIEIHDVPGYRKHADRAIAALRSVGLVETDVDTMTWCAAVTGVDPAGFTAAATVPLTPDLAAIDAVRLVCANLANTIAANWQGTVDQTDTKFLHELRIAVRRSRSVLANAKRVVPDSTLVHARGELAWLAALTSTPRDLDVYLLEWSKYTDPLGDDAAPLLEPVRDLLERQRVVAHLELEDGLRSERAATFMTWWRSWLAGSFRDDSLPQRAARPIGPLVSKRIGRAHEVLLERGRLIGPESPAEPVHDLRKDAKKLRYLLECFGSLLPSGPHDRYVRQLKALQDTLGEHQDAEVHVQMLRSVAAELHDAGASADTMVAIGQLTERLDQQRTAARAEFADRFAAYDTPTTQHALDAMLEGITQ